MHVSVCVCARPWRPVIRLGGPNAVPNAFVAGSYPVSGLPPQTRCAFINSVCTHRALLFAHAHITQLHMAESKHASEVEESPEVPTVDWMTTQAPQITFPSAK